MTGSRDKIIISFGEMNSVLSRILLRNGFSSEHASHCAEIFAVNTLEGVSSHGINRFPRFVKYVREGYIKPGVVPSLTHSAGSVEQWNGNLGPGPLNAVAATLRAIEIAASSGAGIVAMSNTNHWMRGGTYGRLAASQGCAFIGWTNTEANMPAWGAHDARLGNNPLVFAMPYDNEAIVLDFAMSQFSYGKMEIYSLNREKLPFPGGFDDKGMLTDIPSAILETSRTLPIGYWKGAGLSLMLDIFAAVLSGGSSTCEITSRGTEYGLSQVFIAISLNRLGNSDAVISKVGSILSDYKDSSPADDSSIIRYPGENTRRTREENLKSGMKVSKEVWDAVSQLLEG
jgi:3-dehydro-L-gulonate 2-dehydrogenase